MVFVVALCVSATTSLSSCAVSRELGARVFHVVTTTRPADPARRVLPGVASVCTRGSVTWIVPVGGDDVVLVDTGFDDQARAIRAAVGDRHIRAIFLTHGHLDHAAGTHTLEAPVFVGAADAPALRGEHVFHALYPHLGEAFGGIPIARGPVHEVHEGDEFTFGTRTFLAIATPGHTNGSTSWLTTLDDGTTVLFGGDAVQTPLPGEVHPAPWGFSYDVNAAYDSIRRLRGYEVDYLADSHIGVLAHPRAAFRRAVQRQHSEDTLHDYPFSRPMGCSDDPA
jgi:glyoxylase-like metal-dependent hydrolase (beta-lactamase superfamily II)